jgi:hypothetical protein
MRHSTGGMKIRTALLIAPVAIATACAGQAGQAGQDGSSYADLTASEAANQALGAVSDESKKATFPFTRQQPRLTKMVHGDIGSGKEAWVAVFTVRRGLQRCVWIWADRGPLGGVAYNYDMGRCPKRVLSAKPEAM